MGIVDNKETDSELKEFDLNIEKILESWEVHHAIREIIANALDEQILTDTREISIKKDENGYWHIIDSGRGLNYHHLTQNENEEKLNNDKLIGRFGIGLKDALATLYRHGIKVKIMSKYGIITLKETSKVGFDDIVTLHAEIASPDDLNRTGTDFCLYGCTDKDIEQAKDLFLKFSDGVVLENTRYGQVIRKKENEANIYINGVKVAEEPHFLFSYNITSLTKALKKALNRERTNVGRTAYTDRIKSILLESSDEKVIDMLVKDLQQFGNGNKHDELVWNDVAMYVSKKMSELHSNTTFVTSDDLAYNPDLVDEMKRDGYNPVVVPGTLATKMEDFNRGKKDGHTLNTVQQYVQNMEQTFEPIIVSADKLTVEERRIFDKNDKILKLIGGKPIAVKDIQIAEKLYNSSLFGVDVVGLWEPSKRRILIKRSQLRSVEEFSGTLLHECAHAKSGASDVTRDFELELTNIIGELASKQV